MTAISELVLLAVQRGLHIGSDCSSVKLSSALVSFLCYIFSYAQCATKNFSGIVLRRQPWLYPASSRTVEGSSQEFIASLKDLFQTILHTQELFHVNTV